MTDTPTPPDDATGACRICGMAGAAPICPKAFGCVVLRYTLGWQHLRRSDRVVAFVVGIAWTYNFIIR